MELTGAQGVKVMKMTKVSSVSLLTCSSMHVCFSLFKSSNYVNFTVKLKFSLLFKSPALLCLFRLQFQ